MPKTALADRLLSRSRMELLDLIQLAQASAVHTRTRWHTPGCLHLLFADGGGALHPWHCDFGQVGATNEYLRQIIRQSIAAIPATWTTIAAAITTHETVDHPHHHGSRQTIVTGCEVGSAQIFNSAAILSDRGIERPWTAVPPQQTQPQYALILAAADIIGRQWDQYSHQYSHQG